MSSMHLDKLNRWLTLIANIGVLIGLMFVGFEVRNSSQAVIAQTSDSVTDGYNTYNYLIASDSKAARMSYHGFNNPDKLTDLETFQFSALIRGLFNQFRRVHNLYEAGMLSEQEWSIYATEIAYVIETPGGKLYLEGRRKIDYIDDVIRYEPDEVSGWYTQGRTELLIE